MSNEFIWLIFAVVNFLCIISIYKLFGKVGLFVWVGIATIIANIQVTIGITLFGLSATLGNIMYGTIFLATDALDEFFGVKEAKKSVYMGFFVLVATLVIMQIAIQFHPNEFDFGYESVKTIFGFWFRVVLGSLTAFIISQTLDVSLFQWIKNKLPGHKWLWLRNNGSTMVSQLIDTVIFVTIAFAGTVSGIVLIEYYFTTYIIKVVVAVLDTPFLYAMKRIKPLPYFNQDELK